MAARTFSEDQLEQLRSFPDIGKDDLIRPRRCYQRKHVGVVPAPRHQVLKIRSVIFGGKWQEVLPLSGMVPALAAALG